jgi:hypothetical protein
VGDDELYGIERRHGRLRNIQVRRLLAAPRSIGVEDLKVNEKGAGKARTPPDHDISVDQAGHHGDAMQPRNGRGPKRWRGHAGQSRRAIKTILAGS